MLRKIPVFLYACFFGYLAHLAASFVGPGLMGGFPRGFTAAHPQAWFACGVFFGCLEDVATFSTVSFVFWSGTNETWKAAALWTLTASLLTPLLLPLVLLASSPDRRALFAAIYAAHWVAIACDLAARGAGSFLGSWYGDRTETDLAVQKIRDMIFSIYFLPLPR